MNNIHSETTKQTVHFFVPVYFDSKSFLILREKILENIGARYTAHFHLLDDSSGEDAALKLLKFANLSVIAMPFNLGHQRALVHGLRSFLEDGIPNRIIVTLDGDGEDRPEDLPALLAEFEATRDTRPIVLARRTFRRESPTFKVFYMIYKAVFRALTGTLIQTGNFAVMHSEAIAKIITHPYFDLAYASTLVSLGGNLKFVPCPRGTRYEGRSKMNFSRLAIHGMRMLMPFMDQIAIRGVLAFSLFFGLSTISSLGLGLLQFFGLMKVPNWMLIGSFLFFVLSFISICNFAILITIFANVQGMAMSRLDSKKKA